MPPVTAPINANGTTGTGSNNKNDSHPLSRFQQSARDMIRNLENTVLMQPVQTQTQSKTFTNSNDQLTFEQTIRSMFTSCTFGATSMTRNDDDDDDDTKSTVNVVVGVGTSSTDDSSSSPSIPSTHKRKMQKHQRSKSVTPSTTTTTHPPMASSFSNPKQHLRRLASMHMMESNTTSAGTATTRDHVDTAAAVVVTPTKQKNTAVDHIYEHLFFAEEQARRLQQQQATTNTDTNNNRPSVLSPITIPHQNTAPTVSSKAIQRTSDEQLPDSPIRNEDPPTLGIIPLRRMTQPFPMSKPIVPRADPTTAALTAQIPITGMANDAHNITTKVVTASITQNRTFDDDISAISAHTLEAMVAVVVQQQQEQQQLELEFEHQPSSYDTSNKNDLHVQTSTATNNDVLLQDREPTSKAAFCRASTIPRANHITNQRSNTMTTTNTNDNYYHRTDPPPSNPQIRVSSSSSSSIPLSKRRSSYSSTGLLRYRTPSSGRSITSHHSGGSNARQRQFLPSTSFSPNTSGGLSSGNRSFDRWRQVEQDFWDSVVANDNVAVDDDVVVHNSNDPEAFGEFVDLRTDPTGVTPSTSCTYPTKRSSSLHRQRLNSSVDGWSCKSRGDATTANSTIFSSSMTGISHTGSRHSVSLRERSSSIHTHNSWLAFPPQETTMFHNNPVIFASTAIQGDDDFDLTMESGEI